jgi:mannose-6-phosphate isomerase-like protein (cupin superfamily)
MIRRVIFTKEDPGAPHNEGAVLRVFDSLARAYLEPGVSSVPQINKGIQEIFFVADGTGTLVTDDEEHPIREGNGIYVPPGVEHTFVNDGDIPLELIIVVELVPEGTEVESSTALISNYRENDLTTGHWQQIVHGVFEGSSTDLIFDRENGLVQRHAILIVRIEAMQTCDNHELKADKDDVWYMLKGEGVHVVGEEVIVQTPGMAIQVAPPGHSLINHTEEPLVALCYNAAVYRVEQDGSYTRVTESLTGRRGNS